MYVVRTVAEVVVFFQKCTGFRIILFAGHDHQRHICLRLVSDLFQVVDQAFKDVQIPCLAHVVHALGVIESQTGALSTSQQNGSHFGITNCL